MAEDGDWLATDAKSVLGPEYRAARERGVTSEREAEPERHPDGPALLRRTRRPWAPPPPGRAQ